MEQVRLALVGAGGMANAVHYPSLAEMPDVRLAALCDLVPEKREDTARHFGIPKVYADYREMVEKEDPDGVYILMPPHHLYDVAVFCLKLGKHVFVEKPPAVTTYQSRALADHASRHACLTMVGFNRRFIPLMRRVRDLQREAGPLNLAIATFYKAQPNVLPPYYDGAIDVLHCDAIHAVDALRWMGDDVESVASHVGRSSNSLANRFLAVVEFERGGTGVLLTNWDSGTRVHTFEMHAPGFVAFINPDPGGCATVYRGGREPLVITSEEAAGSEERHKIYGFYGESRYFIDCLKRGEQPECNFDDAAESMQLADDILLSTI